MKKKQLKELINEMEVTILCSWARLDNVVEYFEVNNGIKITEKEKRYIEHILARRIY